MIFPEYYGAPVFAGVEFDLTSGISGHSFHMYVNTARIYVCTVTLLEVEFSGGFGVLADTMTFGDETFTTESRVINAVGGAV